MTETRSRSPIDEALTTWHRIRADLCRHASPDPRFHDDISAFVPDFRGSRKAIERVLNLECYQSAKVVFVFPDNSLQQLRHQVLKDGKKLLVGTRELRRGFVLVDPRRIAENKYEMASFLEGMEKAGIGQYITLAQLVEEGLVVDLFVTGSWVVSRQGKQIWRNDGMLKLQWLLLADRGVLRNETPGITVVHSCQVLDEEEAQSIITLRDHGDDIQCDYVITPEQIIRTEDAQRPNVTKPWLENLSDELTHSTPPVQELKGIKMMEKIMGSTGLPKATEADKPKMPQPEEEMGVDMVTRIMRGYKV